MFWGYWTINPHKCFVLSCAFSDLSAFLDGENPAERAFQNSGNVTRPIAPAQMFDVAIRTAILVWHDGPGSEHVENCLAQLRGNGVGDASPVEYPHDLDDRGSVLSTG